MFGLGMPEILVILAVALIVIGPKKLPDLAKSLGRAIGEFRKATTDLKESLIVDPEIKEVKTAFKAHPSVTTTPSTEAPDDENVPPKESADAKPVNSAPAPPESDKNA